MTDDDRIWTTFHGRDRRMFVTPYLGIAFGRCWRVSYGIGPFYGTVGYVELF